VWKVDCHVCELVAYSNDGDSFNNGDNGSIEGEEMIIDNGGINTTIENKFSMDNVEGSNEESSSIKCVNGKNLNLFGSYNAKDHKRM
jgi:hypothetical protein